MRRSVLFLCALAAGAFWGAACAAEKPLISAVDPQAAMPGEYITIKGAGFGKSRGESFVSVAGTRPTASSYTEWTDSRIVFKLPEFGDAGLIYVHKDAARSNPVIFLTASTIPRAVRQSRLARPVIDADAGGIADFVGRAVTLRGTGFGESREPRSGGVPGAARFSSLYGGAADFVEPDAERGGYVSWKEREIVARIPDGAGNGVAAVVTEHGESGKIPFAARYRGGTKTLRDRRVYAIAYSVDIAVEEAGAGAALYVWFPRPADTTAQKNGKLLSLSPPPFLERRRDFGLYRFTGLKAGAREKITVERLVEVAVFETRVDDAAINAAAPSGPEKIYLEESALVPSNDPGVRKAAAEIAGRERNPYRKARLIYAALAGTLSPHAGPLSGGAAEALMTRRADALSASLLFCALCRAAGVAAAPLAGVYAAGAGAAVPHFWAQFWIEDFGWVPVDVYMGSGGQPGSGPPRPDGRDYYFGNADNRRLAFSEGEPELPALDADGEFSAPARIYSLQNIHEEASAALKAYSSHWSDVTINGIY